MKTNTEGLGQALSSIRFVTRHKVTLALLVWCLSFQLFALAQLGAFDASFKAEPIANGLSLTVQTDGKILVGGSGIIRLNTNGSLDNSFQAKVNGEVWSIETQPDSKILIGGRFSTVNDVPRSSVARLNPDGSTDATFVSESVAPSSGGTPSYIFSAVQQPDGMVLIAGEFQSVGGVSRQGIARLNMQGTLDPFFKPGSGIPNPGKTDTIRSIALQNDGKIIVAGLFPSFNGTLRNNVARLNSDGSVDNSFSIGTGPNNFVNSVVIQPDGKILLAGSFTLINNQTNSRVARLESSGQLDVTFNTGTGVADMTGINYVSTIRLQKGGDLIIGGGFRTVNGAPRHGIAKLQSNGALDTYFILDSSFLSQVYCLALQSEDNLIVSGPEGVVRYKNIGAIGVPASLSLLTYAGILIEGTPGGRYRIEYSTSINTNNWQLLTNLPLSQSPFLFIDTQSPILQRRFYRATAIP